MENNDVYDRLQVETKNMQLDNGREVMNEVITFNPKLSSDKIIEHVISSTNPLITIDLQNIEAHVATGILQTLHKEGLGNVVNSNFLPSGRVLAILHRSASVLRDLVPGTNAVYVNDENALKRFIQSAYEY